MQAGQTWSLSSTKFITTFDFTKKQLNIEPKSDRVMLFHVGPTLCRQRHFTDSKHFVKPETASGPPFITFNFYLHVRSTSTIFWANYVQNQLTAILDVAEV